MSWPGMPGDGAAAATPPHHWAVASGSSWPSPIVGAGDAHARGGSNSILDNMPIVSVEESSQPGQPGWSPPAAEPQKFYSVQV